MVENSAKTSESDSFLRPWHRQTTNHSPSETPRRPRSLTLGIDGFKDPWRCEESLEEALAVNAAEANGAASASRAPFQSPVLQGPGSIRSGVTRCSTSSA
jgi:hypothetical protein